MNKNETSTRYVLLLNKKQVLLAGVVFTKQQTKVVILFSKLNLLLKRDNNVIESNRTIKLILNYVLDLFIHKLVEIHVKEIGLFYAIFILK